MSISQTSLVFSTLLCIEVVTELSVVEASRSSVNITWIPLESNDIVFYEIYYNISGRCEYPQFTVHVLHVLRVICTKG